MKATKHDSPAVLFITLYKKVLSFESVVEILKSEHSNEATEQYMYVPTVLFIMLYKVALVFASAD